VATCDNVCCANGSYRRLGVIPLRFPRVRNIAIDAILAIFSLLLLAAFLCLFTLFAAVSHNDLPNPAGVGWRHGLGGLTREGLLKFRHVLDYTVDAKARGRVRVGLHLQTLGFWAVIRAPDLTE
jgi:hypothetical protein